MKDMGAYEFAIERGQIEVGWKRIEKWLFS
jgi:hypothetical protein